MAPYRCYEKFWFIHRSVDRTKKRNIGLQEFLSRIGSDGQYIFTQRKKHILIFVSKEHALTFAPVGSGLTISPIERLSRM